MALMEQLWRAGQETQLEREDTPISASALGLPQWAVDAAVAMASNSSTPALDPALERRLVLADVDLSWFRRVLNALVKRFGRAKKKSSGMRLGGYDSFDDMFPPNRRR